MKKSMKKSASKKVVLHRKTTPVVNNLGLGAYVGLSLVVYVCVYFFLSSALQVIVPTFMEDSLWNKAQLTLTAVLLTTFMSFGVLMFLTKSTLHKVIKVSGICIMISGFLYMYSLLLSVLG
jgi:hypothetical protein